MTYLTISIVNHNSVLPLQACLNSVLKNTTELTYEIVVVDNLCEECAQPLLEKKFPQVRVLVNDSTLGFSANHNQVLVTAKGNYCLVLNPDVTLEDGVLPKMLEFMEKHPHVALSSPKITYLGGGEKEPPKHVGEALRDTFLLSAYMLPGGTKVIEVFKNLFQMVNPWSRVWQQDLRLGKILKPDKAANTAVSRGRSEQSEEWKETRAVYGACMLFRKAALQSVGLLDEGYFMYYEEIDWCVRARKAGWRIAYLPHVNVNHDGGYSTRHSPLKYISISTLSGLRFHHKHSRFLVGLLMKIVISLVAIMSLTHCSILSILSSRQRECLKERTEMNTRILKGVWNPKTYQTVHRGVPCHQIDPGCSPLSGMER